MDLKHNQTLMQTEGRGWATLDRPGAPGIDQWYPAIYLRPQEERRIWPPTFEGALNTLRVVAFQHSRTSMAYMFGAPRRIAERDGRA